jgi:hypothetical protein
VTSSEPSKSHVMSASKICSATLNDAKYCTWSHSQQIRFGEMSSLALTCPPYSWSSRKKPK